MSTSTPRASDLFDPAGLIEEVAKLRKQVACLSDRQDISDVYLRYMRGFDRNDVEFMRTAFWPDVQINYASQSNTLEEFISRHLDMHTGKLSGWGHLITNKWMEIDGDVAHVEAYVTALFSHRDDGSEFSKGATIISGRYIDRVDRRNGEWRIAVREFIPHFSARTEPVMDLTKTPDGSRGTWDRHDTSYVRPLKARMNNEVGPPRAE